MSGKLLQRLVATFFSFVALVGAQPLCDPKSQFLQDGQCCQLCPPGTRMTSLGKCLEPECRDCVDGEYQDKFTKEDKCRRQPYCDPNKNFQLPVHDSRQRSRCVCKDGFHCSSPACLTCVPHAACGPGYGVNLRGNHSRDTVCKECPQGTFSANSSRTEVCQKWTECPHGQQLFQSGTASSDSICGGQARTHVVAIVVAVVVGLAVLALVGLALTVGRRQRLDGKMKSCWEIWHGGKEEVKEEAKEGVKEGGKEEGKEEAPKEHQPLIATPSDAAGESTQRQVSWDEPRTPEEVDDLSQEISITTEVQYTDNGQCVMQDKGMKEVKLEEV